jgi:hypothetical protein
VRREQESQYFIFHKIIGRLSKYTYRLLANKVFPTQETYGFNYFNIIETFNKRNIWIDGRVVMALASGASGATRVSSILTLFNNLFLFLFSSSSLHKESVQPSWFWNIQKTYSLVQFRSAKRSSFWYNHPPPLAYLPPVINVVSLSPLLH